MKKEKTEFLRNPNRRSGVALLATLGAAALLAIPTVAMAQPAAPGGGPGYGKGQGFRGGYGRHGKRGMRGMRGWHRGRRGFHRGPGGPLMNAPIQQLKQKLSLTPAQVQKIKALRAKNPRAKMMKLRQEKRLLRAKMRAEMLEKQPNLLKVAVLHGKLQKVQQKMGDVRFKNRLACFKILTPEQRMKMRSMRGPRFGKRHGRFGRGRGHGRFGRGGGWGGGWGGGPRR